MGARSPSPRRSDSGAASRPCRPPVRRCPVLTIRRMRALVLDTHGQPVLADVPAPSPAARVLACGLCGSDVEKLGSAAEGTVLGHEVVARIDGRRLALVHHAPCGECERCLAGHESTCERFAEPTIVPGGFAERVALADGVEVPTAVDDAPGPYVEPLPSVLRP